MSIEISAMKRSVHMVVDANDNVLNVDQNKRRENIWVWRKASICLCLCLDAHLPPYIPKTSGRVEVSSFFPREKLPL